MEEIRVNKYLSDAGFCSRREADRLMEAGRVTVDGKQVEPGTKVSIDALVYVDGKAVRKEEKKVLLAFNKPRGIVCTAQEKEKNNIIKYINYPIRIYPVGRLDKDSTGLLLMTNDGDLVNKIMRAGNYHEKEYIVRVNRPITEEFCQKMSQGVAILDTVTRPCKVIKEGEQEFRIILTQGLNRQIRRMCEALGYEVKALKRIRIMNLNLKDLKEGSYRQVEGKEYQELIQLLEDSSSLSTKERMEKRVEGKQYGRR